MHMLLLEISFMLVPYDWVFRKFTENASYLKGRVTERGQIFHPVVHPSNAHNSGGWDRPKLGARNSIQAAQ